MNFYFRFRITGGTAIYLPALEQLTRRPKTFPLKGAVLHQNVFLFKAVPPADFAI